MIDVLNSSGASNDLSWLGKVRIVSFKIWRDAIKELMTQTEAYTPGIHCEYFL